MATDMNIEDDLFFVHDDELEEDTKKEEEETSQRPPPANDTLVDNIGKTTEEHEDILRILVASDIHVGYGENKPNLYLDSVNTFEEVLKIATEKKVDMVLLGGDLFHENNPSRDMQHRVIQLLRQWHWKFVSDASVNFEHSRFDRVNYEDANINVGLPIFTIHGNHDDTAGKGLTILDVLHEAGLVNLFGKFSDIDQFDDIPYGFFDLDAGYDDWFNILVLHQNRPKRSTLRSTGAYLPEQYIPTFFDLVLWGHEHECKPHCQILASSDAAGDLVLHFITNQVKGRKFQCKPIPLQTVRPMVVDEIILDSLPEGVRLPANGVRPSGGGFVLDEMIIDDKISEMIRWAESNRGPQQPKLPLIRLKVTYAGPWAIMQPIHGRQIGAKFEDRAANAAEMVVTRRVIEKKKKKGGVSMEEDQGDIIDAACLDQVISEHFNKQPWEERLTVFTHPIIGKALAAFDDEEKTNTAKANQEFRTALEAARDFMMSKLKADAGSGNRKFGNLKSDNFEMMVRNDLNVLKRQTYGIQGGTVTRSDEFDDEMEDGD
ncbi:putative DNA repair protein [Ostertagia ostertagi]